MKKAENVATTWRKLFAFVLWCCDVEAGGLLQANVISFAKNQAVQMLKACALSLSLSLSTDHSHNKPTRT